MARRLYFAPVDDCLTPLLTVASEARKVLRVQGFTFHLPALTDVIIAKHAAGVDVACIFDVGQAATWAPMAAEIARLKAAGVPYLVGTSQKHALMHTKLVLADTTTAWGSFNLTHGSQNESNVLNIEVNRKVATQFAAQFAALWNWIQLHEVQP